MVHSGASQGTDGQTTGQAQRREGLASPQVLREKELTCCYLAPDPEPDSIVCEGTGRADTIFDSALIDLSTTSHELVVQNSCPCTAYGYAACADQNGNDAGQAPLA